MDKAGATRAWPAANIGMVTVENPGKCRHSKWRVIRERLAAADHRREENRPHSIKPQWKQSDEWLSGGNENRLDMKQIHGKTLRFEFA
ncbi:hypothetical protein [Mesorhizobium sp. B2-3-5]|uniref:hypothetical protein n=1 Tax=Mesorhizobium sp. B2-3-5 TaxID=2589958 RepID=UPI00112DA63D|nr:hypothetical protein [Mesorhizobium sp. B2-3-5]TPM32581.1 hypothetical protein FJ958_10740 [Mesorhizobium sp. B2-3-5]